MVTRRLNLGQISYLRNSTTTHTRTAYLSASNELDKKKPWVGVHVNTHTHNLDLPAELLYDPRSPLVTATWSTISAIEKYCAYNNPIALFYSKTKHFHNNHCNYTFEIHGNGEKANIIVLKSPVVKQRDLKELWQGTVFWPDWLMIKLSVFRNTVKQSFYTHFSSTVGHWVS